MHHEIRDGDTATIWTEGRSVEPIMLRLLDVVFAAARAVGYTDIQFSAKRGDESWKRWTGNEEDTCNAK